MRERPGEHTFTTTARRAQIIAATIETIAELGYGQATFARIAERAELSSTRLISYHFANKSELIGAVVGEIYQSLGGFMTERVGDQPDARSALAAYITCIVEYNADHRIRMRALLSIFLNFKTDEGDSRSYDTSNERGVLGHVQDILRKGQADGEFREFDTFVMAATIQRSLDGLPFLLRTEPDLDLTAYARELVTTFDLATRRQD